MECIICFEEIHAKDIIIMECCKQIIHKNCIKEWTKNNINKISDINCCFYCKQHNGTTDYIIDLINNETCIIINTENNINNDNEFQVNDNDFQVNNNIFQVNNNIEINNNIIQITNNHKCTKIIIVIISLTFIISIIIFTSYLY
jgi:hypothetical protein